MADPELLCISLYGSSIFPKGDFLNVMLGSKFWCKEVKMHQENEEVYYVVIFLKHLLFCY